MYNRILIPIDIGQEGSWRHALPVAIEQAHLNKAELHVLAVAPETPPQLGFLPPDYGEKMVVRAREKLEEILNKQTWENLTYQPHVRQGSIYKEILNLATDINADLIIMASHQPGLEDYLLGPNSARVVRHAQCSVLVVRD
jgi:nucleotide-binding universal stress UspA family protein